MREIKFRAYNKEWGMMLPIDKIEFENGKPVSISVTIEASDYDHTGEWQDYVIGDDIILMQYTGLLDKNGKEVFEGDIVESDWYEDKQRIIGAKVYFSAGRFTCLGLKYDLYEMPELEIIGNIYENPKLLK